MVSHVLKVPSQTGYPGRTVFQGIQCKYRKACHPQTGTLGFEVLVVIISVH